MYRRARLNILTLIVLPHILEITIEITKYSINLRNVTNNKPPKDIP